MKQERILIMALLIVCILLVSCNTGSPSKNSYDVPTVITAAVANITAASALCGGDVTDDGGKPVTERGVQWQEDINPAPNYFRTSDGAGSGAFTSTITGLTEGVTYSVRAYATNSEGTGYGNTISFTAFDPVTDIDGNVYHIVKIGNQFWLAENLKTTRYRNGDQVPEVTGESAWNVLGTGAYCSYQNSTANAADYGYLYNWFAAADARGLAPEGWHIPTDAEWRTLELALGMTTEQANGIDWRGTDEGGKLKEEGSTHWSGTNTGATNETGFTALPGGARDADGSFTNIGYEGLFWTSSAANASNGWYRVLQAQYATIGRGVTLKKKGFSVRCIRD